MHTEGTPTDGGDAVAVQISRDQRDALHSEIRTYILDDGGYLGDFANALRSRGHGFDARERWAQMSIAARILDAIGWDLTSDRDTYTLPMDSQLAEFARWRLMETKACLTENAEGLAEIRAGHDPAARYVGERPAGALELERQDMLDRADNDLAVVGACLAILDQLSALES